MLILILSKCHSCIQEYLCMWKPLQVVTAAVCAWSQWESPTQEQRIYCHHSLAFIVFPWGPQRLIDVSHLWLSTQHLFVLRTSMRYGSVLWRLSSENDFSDYLSQSMYLTRHLEGSLTTYPFTKPLKVYSVLLLISLAINSGWASLWSSSPSHEASIRSNEQSIDFLPGSSCHCHTCWYILFSIAAYRIQKSWLTLQISEHFSGLC